MTSVAIDLTDVDAFVRGEHHAMFEWLRQHDPVYWHPLPDGGGFWALTRYEDVQATYLDSARFKSSGGAMLGGSYRNESDTAGGRMLVSTDPPRHRLLRQLIHRAFSPEAIEAMAARVRTLVDAAVDQAVRDGGCDFAVSIAPELPAGVLMEMFDIGHTDARALVDLTRRMIGFRDPAFVDLVGEPRVRLAAIQSEIFELLLDLVELRRKRPGTDLVSMLLAARLNDRNLPEEDVLHNCMNVAVGGDETTSHAASSGIIAFIDHPGEYRRLVESPNLLETAINEILRWSSTNAYVLRIAAEDHEIGGRTIRRGDSVTLWNVSANRDAEQFDRPDVFDVSRTPNRHLSYGSGIHRCIGAGLAHVELTILLERLVRDDLRFELAGDVRMVRSNFILGVSSLPVSVRPQRATAG